MRLFDFFKRKKEPPHQQTVQLHNPVSGYVMPITEVSDPVFAKKMMGDGFAVIPETGKVYSPAKAVVMSVFPAKHAIDLKLANGVYILIHLGVDTVELEGVPFEIAVEKDQIVDSDTLLAEMDLEALKAANKENTVITAFTNMGVIEDYTLSQRGQLEQGVVIGTIKAEK